MSLSEARGFFWGIRCPEEKQDRIRMTQMGFLQLNSLCSWTKRNEERRTKWGEAEWSVVKGYKHRGKLKRFTSTFFIDLKLSQSLALYNRERAQRSEHLSSWLLQTQRSKDNKEEEAHY